MSRYVKKPKVPRVPRPKFVEARRQEFTAGLDVRARHEITDLTRFKHMVDAACKVFWAKRGVFSFDDNF